MTALAATSSNRLPILAAEIEAEHQAAYGAARTALEHAAHCGRLLIEAKALVGHGNWLAWIAQNTSVGPREVQRYMRVASRWSEIEAKCDTETHLSLTDAVALLADHNHRAQGTGENEWYTPGRELTAAREVLGEFDLDPASSHRAQETVRAKKYFTVEDDGLAQERHGRVWLNPPYAQPHIANFVNKMVEEYGAGRVSSGIMLTHNYTDTAWFHLAAGVADAFCFTDGRVKFLDPNGDKAVPTQGQAFFYFGDEVATFGRVFSQIGVVGTFGLYEANSVARAAA